MRKLLVVGVFTLLLAATAVADQINFNFTTGLPGSVKATTAGLTSGPSKLTSVSDSDTSVIIPTAGTYKNGNTGASTSFGQFGPFVIGTFSGSGAASVLVVDSSNNVLVAGTMDDGASLLSTVPAGSGSFLSTFHVTFVDPAVLALFGVGPNFSPDGSVAFTIGRANFNGTTFTGSIGGGAVTIESSSTIPEPAGLGILGMGLLTVAGGLKRWRATHDSPSQ